VNSPNEVCICFFRTNGKTEGAASKANSVKKEGERLVNGRQKTRSRSKKQGKKLRH